MKVTNEINIAEINGKDVSYEGKTIKVSSEPNKSFVTIQLSEGGDKIVVWAESLRKAIDNATNHV